MGTNQIFDIEICSGWKMCRTYPAWITIIPLVCSISSLLYLNSIMAAVAFTLMFRDGKEITTHTHTRMLGAHYSRYICHRMMYGPRVGLFGFFLTYYKRGKFSFCLLFPAQCCDAAICRCHLSFANLIRRCVLVCGRLRYYSLVLWWDGIVPHGPTWNRLLLGPYPVWFPDVMRLGAFIFFELNVVGLHISSGICVNF